jgi:hypothetical protein
MARQMYQQKNGAKDTATTKASAIAEDGTYDISKEFGTSLADLDEARRGLPPCPRPCAGALRRRCPAAV